MKTLIMCLLVLGLTSCAHKAYVKSWDGDEQTICGHRRLTKEDFDVKASQVCSSKFKTVGYFEDSKLDNYSVAAFNKNQLDVHYKTEHCYVYQCE